MNEINPCELRTGGAVCGTTRLLVLTLIVVATTACARGRSRHESAAYAASGQIAGAPTLEELASATYEGILDQPVTLDDGRWQGRPFAEDGASRPMVGLVDHFILEGDLDGDGQDDAAVLVWESSGGSGTRLHLATMGWREGGIANLGTVEIGDRVQVRSGTIERNRITLSIVRAGPGDAMCCPTQNAKVTWTLRDGSLVRAAEEVTGTLSAADLEGPEWLLLEFPPGHDLPEGIEITLVFQDDRVSGHGGCNSYFAGIVAANAAELRFGGMGATRLACRDHVMELERRYLKTLAGTTSFSFLAGRLVLSCQTDDGAVALVFAPRSIA